MFVQLEIAKDSYNLGYGEDGSAGVTCAVLFSSGRSFGRVEIPAGVRPETVMRTWARLMHQARERALENAVKHH